jgi:hypothetical protein
MQDLKNWCPGRSVLVKTNPWRLILAQACGNTAISDAIASAIGCLAGMYIYDYLADERIREAVCRRYTMAAEYYQELLKDLKSKRPGEGEESVALGVVLSTIHVSSDPKSLSVNSHAIAGCPGPAAPWKTWLSILAGRLQAMQILSAPDKSRWSVLGERGRPTQSPPRCLVCHRRPRPDLFPATRPSPRRRSTQPTGTGHGV